MKSTKIQCEKESTDHCIPWKGPNEIIDLLKNGKVVKQERMADFLKKKERTT